VHPTGRGRLEVRNIGRREHPVRFAVWALPSAVAPQAPCAGHGERPVNRCNAQRSWVMSKWSGAGRSRSGRSSVRAHSMLAPGGGGLTMDDESPAASTPTWPLPGGQRPAHDGPPPHTVGPRAAARGDRADGPTPPDPASCTLPGSLQELLAPAPLLERVASGLLGLVPGAVGTAVILPDEHGHLVYAATAGYLTEHLGARLDLDSSLTGLAYLSGDTLRCDDTSADHRVDVGLCRRLGVASMLCVPLRRGDRSVGVLKVESDQLAAFDDRCASACLAVADTVATLVAAADDLGRATANLSGLDGGSRQRPADNASRFVRQLLAPGTVAYDERRARLQQVAEDEALTVVVQPIVSLADGRVTAVEALARFLGDPPQPPHHVLADAWSVGLGARVTTRQRPVEVG